MRNSRLFQICFAALVILISQVSMTSAAPLRTAFTYSGMLMDESNPANGLYDFSFGLFDMDVNGMQLGSDVNVPMVNVIDGLFKVDLDFGSGIFTGQATWLDIGIRQTATELLDQQQTDIWALYRNPDSRQSFTPAISGFLTKVEIYGKSPLAGSSSPGTLQIYDGNGIGGALLATEDVTWTGDDAVWQTFAFSSPPLLASGSMYTLRILVPVPFEEEEFFLGVGTGNPYPGGIMFGWTDPNQDLAFKAYIVSDQDAYTQLSPREEITTVPNAQYTMLAEHALLAETVQIPLILEGAVASPNSVIMGINTGTGGGVHGKNNGNEGYLGTTSYGIYGIGTTAGYFQGNAHVTGNLTVDGRVGVGTATPQTQLNITKTLTIGANSNYEAPGSGSNLELRYRTDSGLDTAEIISINRSSGGRKQIRVDGDPIILRPGFVGIGPKFGTTVPTYELEVEGTIKGDYFNGVPWCSPQFVINTATAGQRGFLATNVYKYRQPFDTTIQGVIISAGLHAHGDNFAVSLHINGAVQQTSPDLSIEDFGSVMRAFQTPINVSAGQVINLTCAKGNGYTNLAVFLYGRYNEHTPAPED